MTTVDAGSNPDLANAMLGDAFKEDPSPGVVIQQPKIAPPPELSTTLLVGVVDMLEGVSEKDAVVRELTGADEEALTSPSLAKSVGKYLHAAVVRGTESIGGRKPTEQELAGLLVGDRELLLLAIRKATYGDELPLITTCPHCDTVDENYVFDLNDVPVKGVDNEAEAMFGFDLELSDGRTARVTLMTAAGQDSLLDASANKSRGEVNSLMLGHLVQQIDGMPVMGAGAVKAMKVRDRNAILEAVAKRTPGPQIGEAKRTCGACEKEFGLGLGLLDIFRA